MQAAFHQIELPELPGGPSDTPSDLSTIDEQYIEQKMLEAQERKRMEFLKHG